ncbi:hypothetical protein [Flavobacterium sp. N1994]|uniref:hypothetical protein n=1 Tax=Flavobacterium sp. N1994 TaxID=2986827 RepID=UPI0022213AFA|nr:hypothetical protein [Flavobacterium sp. N1994]
MKKQLLFMAIAGLFTSMASATDLIVRDAGAGGAYATITAAITAANDGDRIIIRPKVGNVPYQESVLVNKSLTFVTEIQGDKYEINGTITIEAMENRTVTIQDAYIVNTQSITMSGAVSGSRQNVNILNCFVAGNINLGTPGVTATITGSDCAAISIVHGIVTANATKRITLVDDTFAIAGTGDVYIIANKVSYPASGNYVDNLVTLGSGKYAFHVMNNFINDGLGGPSLTVTKVKAATTNEIYNNFLYTNKVNEYGITISAADIANISIVNNAFDFGSTAGVINSLSSAPYVLVQYNINEASTLGTSFISTNVDVNTNNISGPYNFSSNTGVASGTIINGGNPDNTFADIDLTRSDMGPTGGSYAWSNYWTGVTSKPHVFFLNTPRTIFNGTTTFSSNGTAVTK